MSGTPAIDVAARESLKAYYERLFSAHHKLEVVKFELDTLWQLELHFKSSEHLTREHPQWDRFWPTVARLI